MLTHAPPKPRLERLGLWSTRTQPDGWWAARWRPVLAAHPLLRELRFGPFGLDAAHVLNEWLQPLEPHALSRVSLALEVADLAAVHAWRQRAAPRFEVHARLSAGMGTSVELGPQALTLRTRPDFAGALEQLVRTNWPASVPLPPLLQA